MMSSRMVALTLVISFGAGSGVLAEGPLIQSASRAVQKIEREQKPALDTSVARQPLAGRLEAARPEARQGVAPQRSGGAEPTVSQSGLRMRTKLLIYGAIGAAFAASAFTIDRNVRDVTPSHLGTRHDGCKVPVFGCN